MITNVADLLAVLRLCEHFDFHIRTFAGDYGNSERKMLVIYGYNYQCSRLLSLIDVTKMTAFSWRDAGDRYATVNVPMSKAMMALWNVAQ
jgi:hypothetical protein